MQNLIRLFDYSVMPPRIPSYPDHQADHQSDSDDQNDEPEIDPNFISFIMFIMSLMGNIKIPLNFIELHETPANPHLYLLYFTSKVEKTGDLTINNKRWCVGHQDDQWPLGYYKNHELAIEHKKILDRSPDITQHEVEVHLMPIDQATFHQIEQAYDFEESNAMLDQFFPNGATEVHTPCIAPISDPQALAQFLGV